MRWPRARWVMVIVLAGSLLSLARGQRYFGRIYHGWDAQFYFVIARSLLFNNDVDITNDLRMTPQADAFDPTRRGDWRNVPRRPDGGIPDKYPIGLSLVELPLLALGRLNRAIAESAGISVGGAPGYSAIELWTVAVGLVAIFACGLSVLYRMIAEDFSPAAAALGVAGCWLGTSLYYYSAVFVFMSHAVSFVMLVGVLWSCRALTRAMKTNPLNAPLALLGLWLAGVFLVRPQQAMIALFVVPLVLRAIRGRPLSQWGRGAAVGAACGAGALAAELAMNYWQFHSLSLSGYAASGERFHWLHPQFAFVLLNPTRGLILFSPVVVLAACGYIVRPDLIPRYAWPSVANAAAQIYLIAAWWDPHQGDAFGCRMWSDNSAVVAIGLAILFCAWPKLRWPLALGTAASVGWTTLQLARYVGVWKA